jgi:hypothetical protein
MLAAARHAVLSHCSRQHAQDLPFAYPPTLDQADQHPKVAHNVEVKTGFFRASPGSAIGFTPLRWRWPR